MHFSTVACHRLCNHQCNCCSTVCQSPICACPLIYYIIFTCVYFARYVRSMRCTFHSLCGPNVIFLHRCYWIACMRCDCKSLIIIYACAFMCECDAAVKAGKIGINYSWWIKIICICMIASSRFENCCNDSTPIHGHIATATAITHPTNYILIVFSQLR